MILGGDVIAFESNKATAKYQKIGNVLFSPTIPILCDEDTNGEVELK